MRSLDFLSGTVQLLGLTVRRCDFLPVFATNEDVEWRRMVLSSPAFMVIFNR